MGVPRGAGLVVKLQKRATRALAPCYEQLAAALPEASAVNLDETGTKQAGRKGWMWVAAKKSYTLFTVRQTRVSEVVRDLLGEDFSGAITTDRYGGYNGYELRQVCWAHLLRDFPSLIDAGGAFHLVIATLYLVEYQRRRGITALLVAKSAALVFLTLASFGDVPWSVPFSAAVDGLMLVSALAIRSRC